MHRSAGWFLALSLLAPGIAPGQGQGDIKELKVRDWQPRSMLITKVTEVPRPAFPVVDVHNHLGGGKATLTPERVERYLAEMDAAGVRAVVNLDGGWGPRLKETIAALDDAHPGRFLTYALIDFSRHRRADLVGSRGRAARRELRGRRQGPEVPQDAGPRASATRTAASCRSTTRSSTRSGRSAPAISGRSRSTRATRRVLHAARPVQRAMARAERASRVALPRQGLPRNAPSCTPSGSG